jgi:hypothetical protein
MYDFQKTIKGKGMMIRKRSKAKNDEEKRIRDKSIAIRK